MRYNRKRVSTLLITGVIAGLTFFFISPGEKSKTKTPYIKAARKTKNQDSRYLFV